MARSRNIKPSLFKNEDLGTAEPLLTILFAGLWCLADREGRLEDRPLRINAEIFPYRGISLQEINGYLTVLASLGLIRRYKAGDLAIIQVVKFAKHQSPHKTEKDSELPPEVIEITQDTGITVNAPLNNGNLTVTKRSDSLIPDSLIPDSLIETVAGPNTPPLAASISQQQKKVGTRIPPNFTLTPDLEAWARSRFPELNLENEVEKFRNHFLGATGRSAVKMDWPATFRNWILRAKDYASNKQSTRKTPGQLIAGRPYRQPDQP